MNKKVFEFGERRLVTLSVWLNDMAVFSVMNPTWELVLGNVTEDSGTCDIEQTRKGYDLTALIQPKQRRLYTLRYTFTIGEEIIKRSVQIEVV
jgi:hypothetical protein